VIRLFFALFSIVSVLTLTACANIGGASKSATSLTSFLGFSELPDWYIRSKYSYSDSKWIDNDFGLPIHYRDVGEGPVVVLLHGEISSLHTWDKWIETLSQDFRVIAIDLPGSGLTSAPHCLSDPRDTCADNLTLHYIQHTLEFFIEDLKLDKFSLVGSSYGGYLAALYALERPQKLDKLVLISPLGFQQNIPWILNYVTTPGMDVFNKYIQPATVTSTIIDNFYGDPANIKRVNFDRTIHLAQSKGAHKSNVYQLSRVRQLMEHGMLFDMSDIVTPTLLMWGEKDSWGSLEHATRWKDDIGDSILVKYPLAGHSVMEEFPAESVADAIAYFTNEPLPSIEGLGLGGSFTISEAAKDFDKEAMFGPSTNDESDETDDTEIEDSHSEQEGEEILMDDSLE
jgi:pimeloyl-ACP methyl ester carboxylesterase